MCKVHQKCLQNFILLVVYLLVPLAKKNFATKKTFASELHQSHDSHLLNADPP